MLNVELTNSLVEENDNLYKSYQQQGFYIQPNVFSDSECMHLITAAMQLDNAQNKTYSPSMMPHRANKIFLKAMSNSHLQKLMTIFLGGNISGLQSEFFYCKPGTKGFGLHQDNFFVEAALGVFASAWLALTDIDAKKGGLIVYPGTHKLGLLPVQKVNLERDLGQDPNANNEQVIVPSEYEAVSLSVTKGTVVFIHGHLVHGSHTNSSDEWRYVLLNTYIRRGEKYRSGKHAQRSEVELL